MAKTLFDKVWDSHVVRTVKNGPDILFIDRHMIHEVTSPVAFLGLKNRKVSGYYSMRDDIENAGGIYEDKPAVIDKNLVTTAHYKDMGPWMKAALKILNEKV